MNSAIKVFWSNEDGGYIGTDANRPGCSAFGKTKAECRKELDDAQAAWDLARAKVTDSTQAS